MTELQIPDETLADSSEGLFLIGIGKAILGLEIDSLKSLAIDAYPIVTEFKKPSIVVAAMPESFPGDTRLGTYSVDFAASIYLTTDAVGGSCKTMGWHLTTRDKLLRRFSGMTSETAYVGEGDDCFSVTVRPGIRFDPRAKKMGWLLGSMVVTGRHFDNV